MAQPLNARLTTKNQRKKNPHNGVTKKITKRCYNVLSKFTTSCWAAFRTILGHMQPAVSELDEAAITILIANYVPQDTVTQTPGQKNL